jgi:outer membrane protein OmpA-like peptidoglycan-associated protein
MFAKLLRRLITREASASQIAIDPYRTPVKNGSASNDGANRRMITLSDLTLLLLGFLVVWYLVGKNNLNATNLPAASAEIALKPKSPPIWDPIHIDRRDWQTITEEMQWFVADIGLAQEVAIESTPNEIVISLSDTVPFNSGNAHLREQAIPVLQKIVAVVLNRDALSLEVSSHTDNVPISTSKLPSNWELSTGRARRVARYLIDNGINSSRISVRGYANQRPRAPNSTVDKRSANRRVEIRLYRGVDQTPIR